MRQWKRFLAGVLSASMLTPTAAFAQLADVNQVNVESQNAGAQVPAVQAEGEPIVSPVAEPAPAAQPMTPEQYQAATGYQLQLGFHYVLNGGYVIIQADGSPQVAADQVTPTPTPEITPSTTPDVTPETTPTDTPTPETTPTDTPTPTPGTTVTPEATPEGTVTPEATPEITPEATPEATPTPEAEEEKGTNEELVANQQIVIPPQIEDDFRFSKIDKVYAFAKEECSVLEEMNDSARITGTLPKDGVCYIIQEESNGWLYVESGRVRGFLKSEQLITGEEAEQIRKTAKEEAEANGEKVKFEKAKVELAPLENKSLLRTMTSAQKVVVDKVYGIASGNMVNIRDGKSTDANIVGTISEGQICYLLADKTKEWIFVESGDVRGFIKSEYLMTGDEADSKIKEITDAGQDPEQVCGLANQIVDPKANAACYYTLTSTKAASKMNQVRKALIAYAAQFVGNPYVWGGTDPVNGADCSGFVQTIYGQFGIGLPRTSAAQSQFGMKIPVSDAAPGDLIFYANNGQVYHVVIYIGEGKTIEAASTKSGIVCRGVNYGNAVWATRVIND